MIDYAYIRPQMPASALICSVLGCSISMQAPMMSDRMMFRTQDQWQAHNVNGLATTEKDRLRQSLWQKKDGNGWQGHIAFGDGHVEWSTTSIVPVTFYGGQFTEGNDYIANGDGATLDRSGDDLFSIAQYGGRTRDAGMVVGWGSQTFRHGNSKNIPR